MKSFIISALLSAVVSGTLLCGVVSFEQFKPEMPLVQNEIIGQTPINCYSYDKYHLLKKWLPLYIAITAILFIYLRETKDRRDKQQIAALSKKLKKLEDEIEPGSPTLEERQKSAQEYERKVAAHLRSKGYVVSYNGIKQGFDDEGIDLVATKGGEILLVEIKDWAKDKFIHENYVFQLVGETKFYEISEHKEAIPCLFCSCRLTDQARIKARVLGVKICEEFRG